MKFWLKPEEPKPLNTPEDLAKLGVLAAQAAETLRVLNREVAAVTLWIEAEMEARLPALAVLVEQFHGCVEDYLAVATRFNVADPAQVREHGGSVIGGRPYIVGEKRAEIFVPPVSGHIVPSVGQYQSQRSAELARMAARTGFFGSGFRGVANELASRQSAQGASYHDEMKETVSDLRETVEYLASRIRGISKGQMMEMGMEERPGLATRDLRRSFETRSEDSQRVRELVQTR